MQAFYFSQITCSTRENTWPNRFGIPPRAAMPARYVAPEGYESAAKTPGSEPFRLKSDFSILLNHEKSIIDPEQRNWRDHACNQAFAPLGALFPLACIPHSLEILSGCAFVQVTQHFLRLLNPLLVSADQFLQLCILLFGID